MLFHVFTNAFNVREEASVAQLVDFVWADGGDTEYFLEGL